MSRSAARLFTRTYTNPETLTIVRDMNVQKISLSVSSGSCTIKGNGVLILSDGITTVDSDDISLSAGKTDTLYGNGPDAPLDGIIITPVGGSTVVEIQFY